MPTDEPITYIDSIQDNFDRIYVNYFTRLYRFAKEYVIYSEDAENIVQDVFMMLWEKRRVLNVQVSLTAYLFSIVKNKCIDHLRRRVVADEYKQELNIKLLSLEDINRAFASDEDIERFLNDALNKLPERCRQVFIMSRIEGKKYQEIADELGISVNTVENQMSIALRKLRIELKDYLPLLLFFTGIVK
ncbi:MAG: RNA polymerase sigma-70 factor [Tannerellaceae bacterium]|jgi:RNA polymerase sigma-70 factor (ECF subfamily)|nr:RNA polymerase sigma-70 factor [Tannerellaceae bacterium]